MANYFIDLGAFNGDSIKAFFEPNQTTVGKHYLRIHRKGYHVFAVEASFGQVASLQALANTALEKWGCESYEVMNVIAFIKDGKVAFRCDDKISTAYTLDKYSKGRVAEKMERVIRDSINFPRWLGDLVKPTDYTVVKMDVEGAEFDILPVMIQTGVIELVDELYLEFHMPKKWLRKIYSIWKTLNGYDHWAKLHVEKKIGGFKLDL
jgi:FkbM family methyltransferase